MLLTFLQPALNVILLPIYLKFLSPADYGVYGLMTKVTALVVVVAAFRLGNAIFPLYYKLQHNRRRLDHLLGNLVTITLLLNLAFLLGSLLIGPWLFKWAFKSEIGFYPLGMLAVSAGLLSATVAPYLIFLRNEKALKRFAGLRILLVVLTVVLQYLFIVRWKAGVEGALWALLIANGAVFLLSMYQLRHHVGLRFNTYVLRRAWQIGLPLMPFVLASWVMGAGDRWLVERFLSLHELGAYTLLISIASLAYMGAEALIGAFQPFLFSLYAKGPLQSKTEIQRLYTQFILLTLLGISALIFLGNQLHFLTDNPHYLNICPLITWATLPFFFQAYAGLFRNNLLFAAHSKDISWISVMGGGVLIGTGWVLIPQMGLWGAIWANMASSVFLAVAFTLVSQRRFPVTFPPKTMIIWPLALLMVMIAGDLSVRMGFLSLGWASFGQLVIVAGGVWRWGKMIK